MSGIIQTLIGSYAAPASGGGGGGLAEFTVGTQTIFTTGAPSGRYSLTNGGATSYVNNGGSTSWSLSGRTKTTQSHSVGTAFCLEFTLDQTSSYGALFGFMDKNASIATAGKVVNYASFHGVQLYNGVPQKLFAGGQSLGAVVAGDKVGFTVESSGDTYGWLNGSKIGLLGTLSSSYTYALVMGCTSRTSGSATITMSASGFNSSGTYT